MYIYISTKVILNDKTFIAWTDYTINWGHTNFPLSKWIKEHTKLVVVVWLLKCLVNDALVSGSTIISSLVQWCHDHRCFELNNFIVLRIGITTILSQ